MSDDQHEAGPLISRDELANIAISVSTDNDREPDPLHVGMMVTALTILWRQYEAERNDLRRQLAELQQERDDHKDNYENLQITAQRIADKSEQLERDNAALTQRVRLAEASEWEQVTYIRNDQEELFAGYAQLTIAMNGVGLGTIEWPNDGYEYAVCKRTTAPTPGEDTNNAN